MKERMALWCMALLISKQVLALDTALTLGLGAEHTDNALKAAKDQQSEVQTNVSARFELNHVGSDLTADVSYSALYTDYDKDSQEDDTVLEGRALLVYEQIDDVLTWTLENTRRNVLKDRVLNDLQDNREDRSISRIEPRLTMTPSARDKILWDVSYTDIQYDDSDQQDSTRLGSGITWQHSLSSIDVVSLDLSYDDVQFDGEQSDNDYEYYLATVGYSATLSRLKYRVNVGGNKSKRELEDYDGYYLNGDIAYHYKVNTVSLIFVHELTDTSRGNNNEGVGDQNTSFGDVDIFERSNLELDYLNTALCGACEMRFNVMAEEEDYEEQNSDSRELRFGIDFLYQVTRSTDFNLSADYSELSFIGGNLRPDYDVSTYRLTLTHRIMKELSLKGFVGFEERQSEGALAEYEELRGGLDLSYRFR